MVADVAPRDASDRLIIFQNRFDTLYRKYQTYSGGEVLFGLPVTEHPELLQVRFPEFPQLMSNWGIHS